MDSLKNKVAIITGGAGGIGIETAKLFLQEGAKVMLVDRDEDSLKAEIKKIDSPNIIYCIADVSKEIDVSRYVSQTLKEFHKIDIFFNNAGINAPAVPLEDLAYEDWKKVKSPGIGEMALQVHSTSVSCGGNKFSTVAPKTLSGPSLSTLMV